MRRCGAVRSVAVVGVLRGSPGRRPSTMRAWRSPPGPISNTHGCSPVTTAASTATTSQRTSIELIKFPGQRPPHMGRPFQAEESVVLTPLSDSPKSRRPDDDPPLGAGSLIGIAQTAIPADVERPTSASVQATAWVPRSQICTATGSRRSGLLQGRLRERRSLPANDTDGGRGRRLPRARLGRP